MFVEGGRLCHGTMASPSLADVGRVEVVDEHRYPVAVGLLLAENCHPFGDFVNWQEGQTVQHPTEKLHVVVRPVVVNETKLLHFSPRTYSGIDDRNSFEPVRVVQELRPPIS